MGIEGAKHDLAQAHKKLGKLQEDLNSTKEESVVGISYANQAENAVRDQLIGSCSQAGDEYELGVQDMRAALEIYTDTILPALEASGLAAVDGPQAQAIAEGVQSLESGLEPIMSHIMACLFKDEVFMAATASAEDLSTAIANARGNVQSGLLNEKAGGFFPEMLATLGVWRNAVQGCRDTI